MLRVSFSSWRHAACLFVAVVAAVWSGPAFAQSATERREAAVLRARAGHVDEALQSLRAMLASGTDDGLVAMDLATLLQQNGKAAEAAEVFARAAKSDAPDYALIAATRANRDIRNYAEAERLAREGLRRFPGEPLWPVLLSLILSDAGRPQDSLAMLKTPAASRATPLERTLAEAYAWRRAGDDFAALRAYAEAARLAPGSREPRREQAGLLEAMGAPFAAAEIGGTTPSIAAGQAGSMVRWGAKIREPEPARRYVGTDAALARLDVLLAGTPLEEKFVRRRLRLDRLVALRDRGRWKEAVEEGTALQADGPLPGYADEAFADALLTLRRPKEAREAYDRVLKETPDRLETLYGHFYASVELEDFTSAYADIDRLLRIEPVWRTYAHDPSRYANSDRTSVEVTAAQSRLYGNQHGEAWERIAPLAEAAPANHDIRLASYQIANARGWPRLARQEAEIAASLAPRNLGSRTALVETAMAGHRYGEARALVAELLVLYPENESVRRLAREVEAQAGWLFEFEAKPANSSGGGANAVGQELQLEGRLFSPAIFDHWRLFGLGTYASAVPPEGFVNRQRYGAGLDYRDQFLTVEAYPTYSFGTFNRAGGGATVDWSITDQLSLGVVAEIFSTETPLRALYYGITADEFAARLAYRWHESRTVAVRAAVQPFSDGNLRQSATLTWEERLIALPHFDLTSLVDVGTSSNSLTNVPYFSPARDLSATAGFLAEHVVWRSYDNSLTQALRVEAGLYAEQGYANDWIGTASYEHRWRFDPLTEFHYGVQVSRRVYDGSELREIALLVGLRQRI
jgi:biofilm PGA synthesis protein PgaA